MNGRDQPEGATVGLFQGRFAREGLSSLGLRITTSLGIPLFNQIAFHYKILSYALSPLQQKSRLWYTILKFEARNSKYETNPSGQGSNVPNKSFEF